MSGRDGYSRPGLFGGMNHYDSKGHKADRAFLAVIQIMTQKAIKLEQADLVCLVE